MANRKRVSALAVEGVVIVVSILLAFALDAGWEERGERAEERLILENLEGEFQEASAQLDWYLLFHDVTLKSTEEILDAVREGRAMDRPVVEVPIINLARTLIGPTFDPRMGTLDGLLHSGRGGILQSDQLQKSLSGWPGLLAEAKEEEARIDRLLLDQLEPALRTQTDISVAHLLTVEIMRETCENMFLERSCENVDEEAQLHAKWRKTTTIPVSLEILGLFSARYGILSHGIDQFREVRQEIDSILKELEAELGM